MIKHVVCFKIKEEYKNRIEEAKKTLLSMKGKVPTALDIKVGIDFTVHCGIAGMGKL